MHLRGGRSCLSCGRSSLNRRLPVPPVCPGLLLGVHGRHVLLQRVSVASDEDHVNGVSAVAILSCDPTQEEEAAWLSGCLLLPRPLLLAEVQRGANAKEIARRHGVSEPMAQYRLRATGVIRQTQAAMNKRRSRQ